MEHCLYCDKPLYVRGVCYAHYRRAARAGRLDLLPPARVTGERGQGRPHGRKDGTPRVTPRRATWYAEALALRDAGATRRDIARQLGKSYRTVQVALNKLDRKAAQ